MPTVLSLLRALSRGSAGSDVSTLQQLLTRAGYDTGGVDGSFGPSTRDALMAFQREHGLTPDGVAGAGTIAALKAAPNAQLPLPAGDGITNLESGSRGSSVAMLQRALKAAGFDPGSTDGTFGADTDAALRRFQAAKGLDVDGVAGPSTWRALRGGGGDGNDSFSSTGVPAAGATTTVTPPTPGASGDLRQRILQIAQSQIGTLEATNRNDGAILKYPRSFGRGSEAWCADFVSWVNSQAGNPMDDASCPHLEQALAKRGQWKGRQNPLPGDLVFFDWDGDRVPDHVGIVKAVNPNGTLTTIEGNTNTGVRGSREGVHERTRAMDTVLGFANPA
jgi:peptidoglycan hydrolase-like protein with peptidoglycan-binding domain